MERKAVVSLLPLVCGLLVFPMQGHAAESADPRPENLVEWATGESAERLSRSSHKTDFFALSNHFISQDNSIFCGPVSSAIVLNALRLGKKEGLPRDRRSIAEDEMAWLPQGADPFYEKYTPNNVLNAETKTRLEVLGKPILIDGESKSDFGLQLRQLAQVLRSHGAKVVTRVVDDSADAAPGWWMTARTRRRSGASSRRISPRGTISCWSTMRAGAWARRAAVTSPRSGRLTNAAIRS